MWLLAFALWLLLAGGGGTTGCGTCKLCTKVPHLAKVPFYLRLAVADKGGPRPFLQLPHAYPFWGMVEALLASQLGGTKVGFYRKVSGLWLRCERADKAAPTNKSGPKTLVCITERDARRGKGQCQPPKLIRFGTFVFFWLEGGANLASQGAKLRVLGRKG